MKTLEDFVVESNAIEGIVRSPKPLEIEALRHFMTLDIVRVTDVIGYVYRICQAPLRDRNDQCVIVGEHRPPQGGPLIRPRLQGLLSEMQENIVDHGSVPTPYSTHVAYETLHPFMDGNGRSGRAIWAWHMKHVGLDPFRFGFLHEWYYQSLQAFQ